MSREIKFRAWIKNKNRMEMCIEVNPFYVGDCDRFHWKHNEVELMQYIGLKDKNDKEIYEGDIVKYYDEVFKVIYEKTMFNLEGFYCSSFDYPTIAFTEGANYEVIGNVYENPELLEK